MRTVGYETVRGELVRFDRKSSDNWGVGQLRLVNGDTISIVGKVLGARLGDLVEVTGRRHEHHTHGDQLKIESIVLERSETVEGAIAWLADTLPDVGTARAQALIDHCGGVPEFWHTIEHNHAELAEVPGVTLERAARMHTVYIEHRAHRDVLVALRGWGLTTNQIERCKERWQSYAKAVSIIRHNPYVLSREVHGFGFVRADEIAKRVGIAHNAPERIEAGIVHVLDEALTKGHTFMVDGKLQRVAAEEYLQVTLREVAQGMGRAQRYGLIVRRGKLIYSARLEGFEAACAESLSEMVTGTGTERKDTTV
jgi:exodeoxyribonuclease V alpha subunit